MSEEFAPVAEDIVAILRRKATEDAVLRLHLEAALWEAAALEERRKRDPEVPGQMQIAEVVND